MDRFVPDWRDVGPNALRQRFGDLLRAGFIQQSREVLREWEGLCPNDRTNGSLSLARAQLWQALGWLDGALGVIYGLETVRALREDGYRIGVVSNSNGRVAELLEIAGFRGVFETVVDSALVGVEKPDPEIFRIALGRLGAAPESAVYVGDVPCVDLVGAAAAGIRGVLVDPLDLFPEVAAPRIRTLSELPRRLEAFAD